MIVIPILHNNGTSQITLINQISSANLALNSALAALADMSPNMRDYYQTDNFEEARQQHKKRLELIRQIQSEIMGIGEGIADQ